MSSSSVNKVILIGHVGQDPEVRYTPGGDAVCNVSVATNREWRDAKGNVQSDTQWHRLVAWGKLAEIFGDYVRKGREIYVEGRLEYRKYTDKEGIERYSCDIHVNELRLLGRKPGGEGEPGGVDSQN